MGTAQHPTMFQVESEKPSTCSGGGGGGDGSESCSDSGVRPWTSVKGPKRLPILHGSFQASFKLRTLVRKNPGAAQMLRESTRIMQSARFFGRLGNFAES